MFDSFNQPALIAMLHWRLGVVRRVRVVLGKSRDQLAADQKLQVRFDRIRQRLSVQIVDISRRNVEANFDLATSLTGAKNLADIVEVQSAFWRKQFGVLTAQAEEVRVLSTKVTADAVEQVKRGGVHELRKAT